MFIHSLTLTNIRSYVKETIVFPEGSILLSGDIGSGKSSILLAIEFALFGASRPDLPAEALLRKGAINGSVELMFSVEGKEIIVKRNLKKEGENIKQTSGHLIINNIKKELTPVEMKSEVIRLLGYPEETISKNKNYIFRFTVYTPQEEMKYILQESADIRLDVLRKIFNIDKYKNIRENLQIYLKEMRSTFSVLERTVEPLDGQRLKLYEMQNEETNLRSDWEKNEVFRQELRAKLAKVKNEIELLEKEQKVFVELKQKLGMLNTLLLEKDNLLQQSIKKQVELQGQFKNIIIPEELNIEQVHKEINVLEVRKNRTIQHKAMIEQQIKTVQKEIVDLQGLIKIKHEQTALFDEKEKLVLLLGKDIEVKGELRSKKEQLDDLLEKTIELLVRNKTLLQQAKESRDKISGLNHCPTCLQVVSDDYKQKIEQQEGDKIKGAENLLQDLTEKRGEIVKQREEVLSQIEQVLNKENILVKTKAELVHLTELKHKLGEEQERLKQAAQENNLFMQQLVELDKEESVEGLQIKITRLREIIQDVLKKQYLDNSWRELKEQERNLIEQIEDLKNSVKLHEEKIVGEEGMVLKFEEKGKELQGLLDQEKEIAVMLGVVLTKIENLRKQADNLKKEVEGLLLLKEKLLRSKELYNWLEDFFLPLCHTIEKQVMITVHGMFNQLFQEWFSVLIDDETVFARIDDSFSPIIEQNGYEIAFNNLSGGEKTSAALAYRLALNRVINDIIHEIKTKELLILDEPTDGFSSEQLDKVRDVLEKMPLRQTIIVSHESKIETFVENVIRIGKNGHVSGMLGE